MVGKAILGMTCVVRKMKRKLTANLEVFILIFRAAYVASQEQHQGSICALLFLTQNKIIDHGTLKKMRTTPVIHFFGV
jgi:nicotinamide riboside transporter PnuC